MNSKYQKMYSGWVPLLVTAFVLIILPSPALAAHTCNYCHKKIETGGLEVDGRYFHHNHFVCSNCLKPIGESRFFVHNNNYYDSVCLVNFVAERCEHCGKPIIDESIYLNSHFYHASCYNDFIGKRCVVCGEAAQGEFFVDNRGNAVCKEHHDKAAVCHSCKRFLSPIKDDNWSKYQDGRTICKQCRAAAVNKIDEGRKLADEIQAELRAAGVNVDQKFKLSFVSLQELSSKSEKRKPDQLGVTLYEKSEILGGLVSSKKYEIRILHGLPLAQLRAVLAHELMHVWQFANAPQPQDLQMCEGTCQYAAYLVLQNDQTEDGRLFLDYLINQEDEIYGEGFKKVLGYVKGVGLNAWLDYLEHEKDAPW